MGGFVVVISLKLQCSLGWAMEKRWFMLCDWKSWVCSKQFLDYGHIISILFLLFHSHDILDVFLPASLSVWGSLAHYPLDLISMHLSDYSFCILSPHHCVSCSSNSPGSPTLMIQAPSKNMNPQSPHIYNPYKAPHYTTSVCKCFSLTFCWTTLFQHVVVVEFFVFHV